MSGKMDPLKEFTKNLEYHFSEVLERPFSKPYWIYISLSHECTFKCQMCGVVNILKGHSLLTGNVIKTLDEIAGWGRDCVVLFTGGEAFLRKDIFELIQHSVKRGLKAEVVSNGSLITEELAQKIVRSGLQSIAVSLDGKSEKTHDAVRQKGAFLKATTAIKNLVKAKKEAGAGPQISVWTTIMKENVDELFDMVSLAKDLGVECLVFHPVVVAQDDMQNTSPHAPFWIRDEKLVVLKEQIDKIVEYKNKHGLVAFLHDPYLWIEHFKGVLTKKQWKCNPFVFLNIGPDGEVRSCGSSFGNIAEGGLDKCLTSPEADKARGTMKQCQKPCLQTCWAHPESDSLKNIFENFLSQIRGRKDRVELLKSAQALMDHYEAKFAKENASA
jgi:MoaA/NifB/PqqE/SkfB family radical SAM enzyme